MGRLAAKREDIMTDAGVFGDDHPERLGHLVAAHDEVVRAGKHPYDTRRRALVRCGRRLPQARGRRAEARHFHEIAVEGVGRLGRRHVEFPFGGLDESVTRGAYLDDAARMAARRFPRVRLARPCAGHGAPPIGLGGRKRSNRALSRTAARAGNAIPPRSETPALEHARARAR